MEISIDKKENTFFIIKIVFSLIMLALIIILVKSVFSDIKTSMIATITTFVLYVIIIMLFLLFQKVYLIGYMKGNCIEISSNQFKEIFDEYCRMAKDIGIKRTPKLFILQQGGALNAFAIRFSGKNYIAIYSDVFTLMKEDLNVIRFILGHELGHVARKHMSKRFWTCLSSIIPFLTSAYSRHCEYTCDQYGKTFAINDYINGLLLLAAGKDLYKQVNYESFLKDAKDNNTASAKFIGICLSHPAIPKRIDRLRIN